MSDKMTGSCLCRAVKYTMKGKFKTVVNCHCNTCKKITGAAFETLAFISEKNLEIIEGQDALTSYQVSDMAIKHFCCTCGTPIFIIHKKYPGNCMIQVGSLDDPALAAPAINVFCENMLPWVKGIADLKSFERGSTK